MVQHVHYITFTQAEHIKLNTNRGLPLSAQSSLTHPGDDKIFTLKICLSPQAMARCPALAQLRDSQYLHPIRPHTSISPATDRWAERWSASSVK